jgi:flagellar biogenesis protein FliO
MTESALTALGALLALAGAWALWTRRAAGRTGDAIRVVTSRYLGAKQLVTLIEVDGERLLLGVAGDRVSLVARLAPERSPRATDSMQDGSGAPHRAGPPPTADP